jgi:ATP-binding cassette subfamily C protein
MKRELKFGIRSLQRKPLLALAAWSLPEALPAAVSGLAVARAVDTGFLVGKPEVGLAWLGAMMLAAAIGAGASRMVYRHLGDLVEPFRDILVRRVVGGSLRRSVTGRADDGALARLTRQIEIVRDTYAGLIVTVRGFVTTVVGVVVGLLSVAPVIVLLILPPFLLGLAAFLATLGVSSARMRVSVLAEERLAGTARSVLTGARDVVASGGEEHAAEIVAGPIEAQAAADRALAKVATLRTVCFAIGGWAPLLIVLFAAPWLVDQGLTTGAIMGGLTYVLFGLQPTLGTFIAGVGTAGLRFVVTLSRILDATAAPPAAVGTAASLQARSN